MNKKIKVAVGMSGGVDSSVAALLLKQQGYDVVGFFMKLWHDPCGTGENACCDERAQADARAVATKIGIPFYVVDARAPFKEAVTDYFIHEYESVRTPNPCLVCNKKIKFGWLLDFARKNGCDFLATGHYAKISQKSKVKSQNDNSKIINSSNKIYYLNKGVDAKKDQSYFLSGLSQEQLSHIIFPLGEMTKDQVRKIAKENELPVYEKKESQEVCFVENDYRDFLKSNLPKDAFAKGEIVDQQGHVIGQHDGLINYTIGQRKGIDQNKVEGQNLKAKKGEINNKQPLYVLGFDIENNRLIVGNEKELYREEMLVGKFSLTNPNIDLSDLDDLSIKIRYRAKEAACKLEKDGDSFRVVFEAAQRAVTPGQYAVLYHGKEILGSAVIIS